MINMSLPFMPTSASEMNKLNWSCPDILFITGDAYVDHPSFAAALLSRILEKQGFKTAIISQPDWRDPESLKIMGKPRLCCMISGGNIDSMVAHYTASRKKRTNDRYSPGGIAGLRPDRATIVYSNLARRAFGKTPIIIGGLEASLRRLSHYDYWSDLVKKPILLDSKADLLVYGMGELQTLEIAKRLDAGCSIEQMHDIAGTVFVAKTPEEAVGIELPSFEEVSEREAVSNTPTPEGLAKYALAFSKQMVHENPMKGEKLVQACNGRFVVQNPPARPLTQEELDGVYELPYTRLAHPSYDKLGGVPALEEVQFSITSNRGCFGSCSFCAITAHQGRIIQTRSLSSLVREATVLSHHKDFKGYINDLGGPTANFQGPSCDKQTTQGPCPTRQCMFPTPCPNLKDHHAEYLEKLRAVAKVPGVKKVFIRSGIRFDYLMLCSEDATKKEFLQELVANHVSGQLKVAPEHISPEVLNCMGKCPVDVYNAFKKQFFEENKAQGKKQYIIPYFIAAHPGATLKSAAALAEYLSHEGFVPDQVQEFYPTPSTVSTCMYYTGLDPRPGFNFAKVHIPKGREANLQRALLQFNKSNNRALVIEALEKAGRKDLIRVLLNRKR